MKLAIRIPNPLGDAVMALPVVEAARATHPDLVLLGNEALRPLFPGADFRGVGGRGDVAVYRAMNATRILLLTNSFSTAWAAWRAGIPERIGYAMHLRTPLLTRAVACPRPAPHQREWYARLASEAGIAVSGTVPRLTATAPRPRSEEYAVIAPGAGYGGAKRWRGFGGLARALLSEELHVVVLGLPHECRGIDLPRDSRLVDLVGKTSLADLLAEIAHARFVVANDSGLAHVSSALGRRTIVPFGPTDETRTAPAGATILRGEASCAPCHLHACPIDHRCMRSIPVERVLAEALA